MDVCGNASNPSVEAKTFFLDLASTVTDSFPLLTLLDVPVGYAHDAPPAVAAHKVRAAGVVEQGQRGVDGGPEGHLEG